MSQTLSNNEVPAGLTHIGTRNPAFGYQRVPDSMSNVVGLKNTFQLVQDMTGGGGFHVHSTELAPKHVKEGDSQLQPQPPQPQPPPEQGYGVTGKTPVIGSKALPSSSSSRNRSKGLSASAPSTGATSRVDLSSKPARAPGASATPYTGQSSIAAGPATTGTSASTTTTTQITRNGSPPAGAAHGKSPKGHSPPRSPGTGSPPSASLSGTDTKENRGKTRHKRRTERHMLSRGSAQLGSGFQSEIDSLTTGTAGMYSTDPRQRDCEKPAVRKKTKGKQGGRKSPKAKKGFLHPSKTTDSRPVDRQSTQRLRTCCGLQ